MNESMGKKQVFISYSGHDEFEASLLQYAIETSLAHEGVNAWTFQRDQNLSEKEIASSLKQKVKESLATVFLVSPTTLDSGATQWMELAYADAFDIETYVLLHHLEYKELKSRSAGVPPLLLSSQCNPAINWKSVIKCIDTKMSEARI
jgi:hypothetical protein